MANKRIEDECSGLKTPQARMRCRYKIRGLCVFCGKVPEHGKVCDRHQAIARERQKLNRAKMDENPI